MSIVVGILSVLMGLVMGLLGGGGSVLTVPLLVYVADQEPSSAIATSLLVVGVASGVSVIKHAKLGNVRPRLGVAFGVSAMIGAYIGGRAASLFSGQTLLVLFAALMLVAGIAMVRPKKQPAEPKASAEDKSLNWPLVVVEAFVVGVVTGLVGAGGGFIIVPTLVLLTGIDMRSAVGTSLLIISMKSFTGLAGHLAHADVNLELAAFVTVLAIAGALFGASLTARIKPAKLKRGFGVFVLIMAVFIVGKESALTEDSPSPPAQSPATS